MTAVSTAILCKSPQAFAHAHLAVLNAGGTSLLPAGGGWEQVRALASAHPDLTVITDMPEHCPDPGLRLVAVDELPSFDRLPADLPAGQVVAVMFTSGSTGQPKAVAKTWGELTGEAAAAATALGLKEGSAVRVLCTAPFEHMYAYMFGFFLPRRLGLPVCPRRPVMPADLQAELDRDGGEPAWVITTPTHLAALCRSPSRPRPGRVAGILSATSPLSPELAEAARAFFDAPVTEIYGSTETGAVAVRRWSEADPVWPDPVWPDPVWHCLPGLSLRPLAHDGHAIAAPYFPTPITLADRLELVPSGGFHIRGRADDIIKVAGKRSSLAALDSVLNGAPGVREGAYHLPKAGAGPVLRPAAFVVLEPGCDLEAVRAHLAARLDPVFMPRPLAAVDQLPRSATGKLARAALEELYATCVAPTANLRGDDQC